MVSDIAASRAAQRLLQRNDATARQSAATYWLDQFPGQSGASDVNRHPISSSLIIRRHKMLAAMDRAAAADCLRPPTAISQPLSVKALGAIPIPLTDRIPACA